MDTLLFDLIEITELWVKKYGNKRITISVCLRRLKIKNPFIYKKIRVDVIKKALIILYPTYKNNRKKVKYYKVTEKNISKFRQSHCIRPFSSINEEFYGFSEEDLEGNIESK